MSTAENITFQAGFTARFSIKVPVPDGITKDDYNDMLLYDMHVSGINLTDQRVSGSHAINRQLISGVQIEYAQDESTRHIKQNITDAVFDIESVGQVHIKNRRTFGVVRGVLSGSTRNFYKLNRPEPEFEKIKKQRSTRHKHTYQKAAKSPTKQFDSATVLSNLVGVLVLIFFALRASNSGQSITSTIIFIVAGIIAAINFGLGPKSLFTKVKKIATSSLGFMVLGALIVGGISFFGSSGTRKLSKNRFANIPDDEWNKYSSLTDTNTMDYVIATEVEVPDNACEQSHDWVIQSMELLDENDIPYRLTYSSSARDACLTHNYRESLAIWDAEDERKFYKDMYATLIAQDSMHIGGLLNAYELVKKDRNLDYRELCDFIVKSIQYIPYSLIINSSCTTCDEHGDFHCGDNCVPGTHYGIFAPSEFITAKRGDCDTRTVLLLTILDYFGYDAVILNCDTHSMLGVNIPELTGEYHSYMGKDYYFWETTATGWEAGMMAPSNQYKSWYVALSTDEI